MIEQVPGAPEDHGPDEHDGKYVDPDRMARAIRTVMHDRLKASRKEKRQGEGAKR
jgi:hypothetical protein